MTTQQTNSLKHCFKSIADKTPTRANSDLSRGVLYIKNAFKVQIINSLFDANWLVDNDYAEGKAQAIYFEDVYGCVTMTGNTFSNMFGAYNTFV